MTPEEIIAVIAPGYVGDPRLAAAIVMIAETVNPDHCFYPQVVANLVAHQLTLADRGGNAGAVIHEQEGGLSRTYASPKGEGNTGGSSSFLDEVRRLDWLCFGPAARTAWAG